MNLSLKKLLSKTKSAAEIADNHLVLSLPEAIEPVVWRMSLDKIGTASFEVKPLKDSEKAKLILKPKKGAAEIIANFETKDEAVNALMIASKALQSGASQSAKQQEKVIVKASGDSEASHETVVINNTNNKEKQKWAIAVLGAILVLGLYYYLTTLIPNSAQGFESSNNSFNSTLNPTDATGVPVSADDFLNGL